MEKLLVFLTVALVLLPVSAFQISGIVKSGSLEPPEIHYLMEDTVTYFSVPAESKLAITFYHSWYYGNATFKIFDENGNHYEDIVFHDTGDDTTKQINFASAGTYKMVACGTSFSYDLKFSGVEYDWKFVIAAFPHKSVFRVRNGEIAKTYFKVSHENFRFYVTQEYSYPTRDGTVKLYDVNDNLKTTIHVPSGDLDRSFEQMNEIQKNNGNTEFWYATVTGDTNSQSRIGLWTDENSFNYPTGLCTLITPSEEYYFVPEFNERNVEIVLGEGDHKAFLGAATYPGEDYIDFYSCHAAELGLRTYNHYITWRWRERGGSGNSKNDDNDPFHINWQGFDFTAYDERYSFFIDLNISPILNLQWSNDCFLSHPAFWDENDMEEFAEFCLAMTIHSVAPDLEEPPVERPPHNITAIQIFGEPNLIFNDYLDRDDALNQYIEILKKVGQRIKNHPDERIRNVKICTPGNGGDIWFEEQKEYWIYRILEEAGDYVDIIAWDQYFKWYLEELDGFGEDVSRIREIIDGFGYDQEIAMPEFNIKGGIPTSHYFFGSNYSALHMFGAIANSINQGMKYVVYFSLVDSGYEPRLKGLMTSFVSMSPYSDLLPFIKKPQFFTMKILGEICKGSILDITYDIDQLDAIASFDDGIYRLGISNRYEAESNVNINLGEGMNVAIYSVENDSINLLSQEAGTGNIEFTLPPWSIYYVEVGVQEVSPGPNLECDGSLSWNKVKPGEMVNGSFTVENVGDSSTLLDWAIGEHPSWGEWIFTPETGDDLRPEDGPVIVQVSVVVPNEQNKGFTGCIQIVNRKDSSDFCMVIVSLATPKDKQMIRTLFIQFLERVLECFPLFERLLDFK